jgi:nitrate reductase NapD
MREMPSVASLPDDLDELHIASLVLHVLPHRVDGVRAAIAGIAGAEVHGVGPTGKMVVTLEGLGAARIAAGVAALQAIEGVLSAALVYQHAEPIGQMNEEASHDPRETDLHQAVGGGGGGGRGRPAGAGPGPEHRH